MRVHWQRRPRLVRGAFPDFTPPVTRDRLFALAQHDDVESRVVARAGGRWRLERGPFDDGALPLRARRDWTLLVQGMDLHDDAVAALLARFRFVADARLDDLMISYAVDGGGVGPHLDSYDVFLIQAHGRRRWRIAPPGDDTLLPDVPLKILARFEPTEEWVLEPGDMLYLPPGWGHDGVALGECMTLSVGFRAPSRHELLAAWFADRADTPPDGPDPRFADPGVPPTAHPGELPCAMRDTLAGWLLDWRPTRAQVDDFIGRFVTEPKHNVWFEPPARRLSPKTFVAAAARHGVRLDRRTRMAYRGARWFVNGESVTLGPALRAVLRRLADTRALPPGAFEATSVDAALPRLLHPWFDAGWIRLDGAAGPNR